MSKKLIKSSQSHSFSEQMGSSSDHKRFKKQFKKGFSKEFPSLNRFKTLKNSADLSNTFTKRAKTEQIQQSRRQISPSEKQISRFIYKHLHKKIAFQQKIYGDLQTPQYSQYNTSTPDILDNYNSGTRRNTLTNITGTNRMKTHVYGYQKLQCPENRQSEFRKPLTNLKQKMLKNQCLRSNMLSMSLAKRRYKKKTHIDAYFDLSCLERIKQIQQKDFLLTNL